MDLSPVLREVGECLSALLPGGSPSVCMYTTNDDAELDRVGRDVYCFFSSGILTAHLPEEFTLPAVKRVRAALANALSSKGFVLYSFATCHYEPRPGQDATLAFRVYAKRKVSG